MLIVLFCLFLIYNELCSVALRLHSKVANGIFQLPLIFGKELFLIGIRAMDHCIHFTMWFSFLAFWAFLAFIFSRLAKPWHTSTSYAVMR